MTPRKAILFSGNSTNSIDCVVHRSLVDLVARNSKQETIIQCWFNAGPALNQHWWFNLFHFPDGQMGDDVWIGITGRPLLDGSVSDTASRLYYSVCTLFLSVTLLKRNKKQNQIVMLVPDCFHTLYYIKYRDWKYQNRICW